MYTHITLHTHMHTLHTLASGPEAEAIFGVPEYVILPTFITSPVFTRAAVRLQQGTGYGAAGWRAEHRAYNSMPRTMQQTRDLLIWLLASLGVVSLQPVHVHACALACMRAYMHGCMRAHVRTHACACCR